jgi:hypothetical protein
MVVRVKSFQRDASFQADSTRPGPSEITGPLGAGGMGDVSSGIARSAFPDSRYIGFFAGGELKKIEASGGPP